MRVSSGAVRDDLMGCAWLLSHRFVDGDARRLPAFSSPAAIQRAMTLDGLIGLIVDDQPHMRRLWRALLMPLGIKTLHEAEDGPEALERLEAEHLDFAVIDYQMPHLNGAELVQLLRKSTTSHNQAVPVILCTAHTSISIVQKCINAGVDEVLAKPVSSQIAKKKMISAIYHRRPMIESADYRGPDRRLKRGDDYNGVERRRATKSIFG